MHADIWMDRRDQGTRKEEAEGGDEGRGCVGGRAKGFLWCHVRQVTTDGGVRRIFI